MDKISILHKLDAINKENLEDYSGNVKSYIEEVLVNIEKEVPTLKYKYAEVDDNSPFWTYISTNVSLLQQLINILDNTPADDVLSVQQLKNLRHIFRNLITVGIRPNLVTGLHHYKPVNGYDATDIQATVIRYRRLTAVVYCLTQCMACLKLRYAVLPQCLQAILSGLYQLVYCPLKKPTSESVSGFIMTENMYNNFHLERIYFVHLFTKLMNYVNKRLYVHETMMLAKATVPPWFKKSVASILTQILFTSNGLENVTCAIFGSSLDRVSDDRAKTWKHFDMIVQLILSTYGSPQFEENMCLQLIDLIRIRDRDGRTPFIFETIFTLTAKRLHTINRRIFSTILLPEVYNRFRRFTEDIHVETDVTSEFIQGVHLIHAIFVDEDYLKNDDAAVSVFFLNDFIMFLYYFYVVVLNVKESESFGKLKLELRSILFRLLKEHEHRTALYDLLLLSIPFPAIKMRPQNAEIRLEVETEKIFLKLSEHQIRISATSSADVLKMLTCDDIDLRTSLFLHCLKCLNQPGKYLLEQHKRDRSLLDLEDIFNFDEMLEHKVAIYKLLSELTDDTEIQKRIVDDSEELIEFINFFLSKTKSAVPSDEHNQQTFIILMILQALTANATTSKTFTRLLPVLNRLAEQVKDAEYEKLIAAIIDNIQSDEEKVKNEKATKGLSELDKALEDVCDELLPVRGHGLMSLKRLIENKDPEAMQRKMYILNIFQQNLKHDDSFIYLSAIGGLAAMGNLFPDVVLNVLCEEYTDFNQNHKEDGNATRMKVGEVTVRVTKALGEMAPKYKALLLNTFLNGTKDEDHLIRASSLSNLGEVCNVLGYKLGSIVNEVLACVDAIVATDKAIEARRAAIAVIHQLFAGLEEHTVNCLKDKLLEIYWTLKKISLNEREDDVMRMHADIAIQQLNENVKAIILPPRVLNPEKKIILLK